MEPTYGSTTEANQVNIDVKYSKVNNYDYRSLFLCLVKDIIISK